MHSNSPARTGDNLEGAWSETSALHLGIEPCELDSLSMAQGLGIKEGKGTGKGRSKGGPIFHLSSWRVGCSSLSRKDFFVFVCYLY